MERSLTIYLKAKGKSGKEGQVGILLQCYYFMGIYVGFKNYIPFNYNLIINYLNLTKDHLKSLLLKG